ncbi:MAG: COG4315 family predicted lipoprotein [Acidimicrobiales bacterium]
MRRLMGTNPVQGKRSTSLRPAKWGTIAVGALVGVGSLAVTALPANAAEHLVARHQAVRAGQVVVSVATLPKYGKVLVDQKGLALYYDTANKPGHWACKGTCLTVWPPLVLPKGQAGAVAGSGVSGLGVVDGPSGRQVTWYGKPLYTYVRDSKGKAFGQGLFHIWYLAQTTAVKHVTTTAKAKVATAGAKATTTSHRATGATTSTKTSSTWA